MPSKGSAPIQPTFRTFATAQALASALTETVATVVKDAIKERDKASLAVPGGKTPLLFFQTLRRQPLAWEKVYVTLTDERWVPTDTDASNEKVVKELLLPPGSHFTGLKNDSPTPEAGRGQCQRLLEQFPRPFDAVIVGMGEDGHIASLFPYSPAINMALAPENPLLCIAMTSPDAPHLRMSLTLSALLQSRHLYLLVTGKKKRDILEQALKEIARNALPVSSLLYQRKVPVEIYWAP